MEEVLLSQETIDALELDQTLLGTNPRFYVHMNDNDDFLMYLIEDQILLPPNSSGFTYESNQGVFYYSHQHKRPFLDTAVEEFDNPKKPRFNMCTKNKTEIQLDEKEKLFKLKPQTGYIEDSEDVDRMSFCYLFKEYFGKSDEESYKLLQYLHKIHEDLKLYVIDEPVVNVIKEALFVRSLESKSLENTVNHTSKKNKIYKQRLKYLLKLSN